MFSNVENIAELKQRLESKSIEELEDMLALDFDEDKEEVHADYIRTILEVIEEKEPLQEEARKAATNAAWQEFKDAYTTHQNTKQSGTERELSNDVPQTNHHLSNLVPSKSPMPKTRRVYSVLCKGLAAAVLIAMLCSMAFGWEFWEELVNWSFDTLQLESKRSEGDFPETTAFKMLDVAVSDLTSVDIIPLYAPEGTRANGNLRTTSRVGRTVISMEFVYDERNFTIQVIIHEDATNASLSYQKNQQDIIEEEYVVNGIPHYIFSNTKGNSVVWMNEGVEVLIQGELTIDELQKMIDSIY